MVVLPACTTRVTDASTGKDVRYPHRSEPDWHEIPVLLRCFAGDGFEDTPDVLEQDLVTGGVGMNEIGQIQF
jgi:hypothetical protein